MKPRKLLTAPQVARLCGADLKTIHNWVNAGRIPHFRTPGRHLRFRLGDVLDFMTSFGYPVPADLDQHERRTVVVLDADGDSRARLRRSLSRQYDVADFDCPVEALLAVGRDRAAALVLDAELPGKGGLDGQHLVERLAGRDGVGLPVVVYTAKDDDERWRRAGAAAVVRKPAVARLRERIAELLATR